MAFLPAEFKPRGHVERKEQRRLYDDRRGSSTQRGYGVAWRRARLVHLAEHPLCVKCEEEGVITPATVVDHETPHRGDMAVFWDASKWQSMCKPHHDSWKQAQERAMGR